LRIFLGVALGRSPPRPDLSYVVLLRLPRVPRLCLFFWMYPFASIHSMFSSDFSSGV